MNKKSQRDFDMNTQQNIEDRLWSYIDGVCESEEKSAIEQLLQSNLDWQHKYKELLDIHQLLHSTELEEPSMRFTRNVMEEIAKYQIAPATRSYINKRIIYGIGAFFATMMIGFLIYGLGQIDWSASGTTHLPAAGQITKIGEDQLNKIDFSKFFNNTYVNIFMMINVVLGLGLLDRYLSRKKEQHTHA
jgi:hypothetical protein